MHWYQYEIIPLSGLCNQLMCIFRAIMEGKLATDKGHASIGVVLTDVQSRESIDCWDSSWFQMKADRYIDVSQLQKLLRSWNISVRLDDRHQTSSLEENTTIVWRDPLRSISDEENKELGRLLANSFPFAGHILEIVNFILDLLSSYSKWMAIHLRIESDLNLPGFLSQELSIHSEEQKKYAVEAISSDSNISLIYIASGLVGKDFNQLVSYFTQYFPHIKVISKHTLLKAFPYIEERFKLLSLEEQALVDWLVCVNAPCFGGMNASSFAYLAGYMRHYRGMQKDSTTLWFPFNPDWDLIFPLVELESPQIRKVEPIKTACFIHVYVLNNWEDILAKKLQRINFSGLYKALDLICINFVAHEIEQFELPAFIHKYSNKIEFRFSSDVTSCERSTLKWMHRFSEENPDVYLLYLHTKGVTRFNTLGHPYVEDWINLMETFLIDEFSQCFEILKEVDACGVNYLEFPSPHFSGNFWWANSNYIKELNVEIDSAYHAPEMWLLTRSDVKFCCLFSSYNNEANTHFNPLYTTHYNTPFPIEIVPETFRSAFFVKDENGISIYKEKMSSLHKKTKEESKIKEGVLMVQSVSDLPNASNEKSLPLVSVLIPSHNRPQFLKEAIESVVVQNYANIEIIISDTSTDNRVAEMMPSYLEKYPHIKYVRNDVDLFMENFHKLFEMSSGEFISYLHDDDLIHPEKISTMVGYFLNDPYISLVTSHRQRIDEHKNLIHEQSFPYEKITQETCFFDGKELINYALANYSNQIGEPSTAIFRKKDMIERGGSPGMYRGQQYANLLDLSMWVSLLTKGKAVYIADTLNYCRVHSGQLTSSINWVETESEWLYLILNARKDGFLATNELFGNALMNYRNRLVNARLPLSPDHPKLLMEVLCVDSLLGLL